MRLSNLCERLLGLFVFSVKQPKQKQEQEQSKATLDVEIVDEKFQIERDNIRQNASLDEN
jgi:hypothetical protein